MLLTLLLQRIQMYNAYVTSEVRGNTRRLLCTKFLERGRPLARRIRTNLRGINARVRVVLMKNSYFIVVVLQPYKLLLLLFLFDVFRLFTVVTSVDPWSCKNTYYERE